jgi:hypothetical protein
MKHVLLTMEHFKPKLIVIGLLFAVPFMLGSGCSTATDAGLEEGPVPFEVLRSVMSESQNVVGCKFNRENIKNLSSTNKDSLSGLELVITTQDNFDIYISCDDTVGVDFEEEFVLAGLTTPQPTQVRIREQSVEMVNGSLHYRVGIVNTFLTTPSVAEYIIKVFSKDYLEHPIFFDIYWVNTDWN